MVPTAFAKYCVWRARQMRQQSPSVLNFRFWPAKPRHSRAEQHCYNINETRVFRPTDRHRQVKVETTKPSRTTRSSTRPLMATIDVTSVTTCLLRLFSKCLICLRHLLSKLFKLYVRLRKAAPQEDQWLCRFLF